MNMIGEKNANFFKLYFLDFYQAFLFPSFYLKFFVISQAQFSLYFLFPSIIQA